MTLDVLFLVAGLRIPINKLSTFNQFSKIKRYFHAFLFKDIKTNLIIQDCITHNCIIQFCITIFIILRPKK